MKNALRPTIFTCLVIICFTVFVSEASAQLAAIAAVDEPEALGEARGSVGTGAGKQASSKTAPKSGASAPKTSSSGKKPKASASSKSKSTPSPPPPAAMFNGPVLGDKYTFLNFEVVSAEKPYYTRAAKASGAKGLVQV